MLNLFQTQKKTTKNCHKWWFVTVTISDKAVRVTIRSHVILQFNRAHRNSYSQSVVTMDLLYRFRDMASDMLISSTFPIPRVFGTPHGVTPLDFSLELWRGKVR